MTFIEKVKHWVARLLVHTRRIKEVRYSADELNELIVESLPHTESFEVPGGDATLTVMQVEVEIGRDSQEGLMIRLLCAIEICSVKVQLYRAHLTAEIGAMPYYNKAQTAIRLQQANLKRLDFVNDEYLLVRSTNDIVKSMTPNILKGIVNVTVASAMAMLPDRISPQIKEYLQVFLGANKQRVLDFHRPQIAALVTQLVESPDIAYCLEQTDFEEKLFADLGSHIEVDEHTLVFKF